MKTVKEVSEEYGIAIRSMYMKDPMESLVFEDEIIYGWTCFDEHENIIDIDNSSDSSVVELFYSLLGEVDE